MARPKKIGLEYFPLDCQMDDKVEMLEAEHGLEGFAVYIKLLQAIYQTDAGELDMAVVLRWKTLGKQYGIPAENLKSMVDTMCEVALFDKEIFIERHVLTSSGIQKRIAKVNGLRERDRSRKIEPEDELSAGKPSDKCIKGKGKENKEGKPSTTLRSATRKAKEEPEHFTSFWQVYPRKEKKPEALKAFQKLSEPEQLAALAGAREWFNRRADWLGPNGEDYRPHPSTWLNQKRWTELTEVTITNPNPQANAIIQPNPQRNAYGPTASGAVFVNDDLRRASIDLLAGVKW